MSSPADPLVPAPPTPPAGNPLRQIFVSSSGIRAGWRVLIFVALYIVLAIFCSAAAFNIPPVARIQRSVPKGTMVPALTLAFELASVCAVFFAAFVMSQIEKGRFTSYGIPLKGAFGRLFWQGVFGGLIFETAEMLLIYAFGGYSFGGLALAGSALAKYAALWAVGFVLVGINEEFTFRGYAQFTLTQGMGFWPSAILLSAVFGGLHLANPGEGWVGGLSVMLFGLFACFTLKRTGNLWFAIGFHAAADYAETFIYSVPDSGYLATGHLLNSAFHGPRWLTGGTIGPEGSILDFVLMALAFVVIAWLYPQKRETVVQHEPLPTSV